MHCNKLDSELEMANATTEPNMDEQKEEIEIDDDELEPSLQNILEQVVGEYTRSVDYDIFPTRHPTHKHADRTR